MTGPNHPPDAQVRLLGLIAVVGVTVFVLVCGAAQFLRADLDWMRAPLSYYLVGPGGAVVKSAYFAFSVSLAAIGLGFYRVLTPAGRSAAPLLLFIVAALALSVTALCDTATGNGDPSLHAFVHNIAAATTFHCVTVAMLLQSRRLRGDAQWRQKFPFAAGLGAVAFVALWIYALNHTVPRGLMQKTVIVLILAWLGCASLWLQRSGNGA
jgi:hypothetical protein